MAEAYSVELRERAVGAVEAREGTHVEIAARFQVGLATLNRWLDRSRSRGSVEPTPKAGGTPSTVSANELETLLKELGDPTANELTVAFNRMRRGANRIHVSSMKRALHRHGYVVKKSVDGRWRVSGRTSSSAVPLS
jgi:transposase